MHDARSMLNLVRHMIGHHALKSNKITASIPCHRIYVQYLDGPNTRQILGSSGVPGHHVVLAIVVYICRNPSDQPLAMTALYITTHNITQIPSIRTLGCSGRPGPGEITTLSKWGKTDSMNCGLAKYRGTQMNVSKGSVGEADQV